MSRSGLIQGRGMARPQAREIALQKLAAVGLGAEVAALQPGRAVGRHAEAGGAGAGDRGRAGDPVFRRADDRARPDHGRCDQRPDRRVRARPRRDGGVDHPRHGQRAQDRRPDRDAAPAAASSGRARPPRSTTPATPMSTSSSTAAPRGRSGCRCGRHDVREIPHPRRKPGSIAPPLRAPNVGPGFRRDCGFRGNGMAKSQARFACQQCGAVAPAMGRAVRGLRRLEQPRRGSAARRAAEKPRRRAPARRGRAASISSRCAATPPGRRAA